MSGFRVRPNFARTHETTRKQVFSWDTPKPPPPSRKKTTRKSVQNSPPFCCSFVWLDLPKKTLKTLRSKAGNGPNTVSERTVSNTELIEFFGPHRVVGRELSEFSQPIICVPKRTHRVFCRTHRICRKTQWGWVSSFLRNSTLETVFTTQIDRSHFVHYLCVCPILSARNHYKQSSKPLEVESGPLPQTRFYF